MNLRISGMIKEFNSSELNRVKSKSKWEKMKENIAFEEEIKGARGVLPGKSTHLTEDVSLAFGFHTRTASFNFS